MGFLKLRVSHQAQPVPPEKAAGQMPPETLHTAYPVSAAAPPHTHTQERQSGGGGLALLKSLHLENKKSKQVGFHLPELEGKRIAGSSLPEKKEITHTLALNL